MLPSSLCCSGLAAWLSFVLAELLPTERRLELHWAAQDYSDSRDV